MESSSKPVLLDGRGAQVAEDALHPGLVRRPRSQKVEVARGPVRLSRPERKKHRLCLFKNQIGASFRREDSSNRPDLLFGNR